MNIKYLNPFFLSFLICISFVVSANKNDDTENMFLVHKTPTCGCCKRWMEHFKEDGFKVYSQDHQNLNQIKEKYNIDVSYRSCHTTVSSNGFIFEGHIPSKYIKQFLSETHENAIGLSVPGMPLGSPGMEYEDRFMPYEVLILYKDGSSNVYAAVENK